MRFIASAISEAMLSGRTFGDTLYASTAAAYDALSDAKKRVFANLIAVHSLHHQYEKKKSAGVLKRSDMSETEKTSVVPEVPTIAESGYPGFFVDNMYGVVVAAKTSRARVEGLHAAIARAVNAPDVKEKLIAQGYDPLANTPAEFSIYLKAEVAKWAKVVKDSGLKAD